MAVAEQIVCREGVATAVGLGFTTTVAVMVAVPQVLGLGVMVKVTVTGTDPVLVRAPLMLPDPVAAIPVAVTVLFLVQL